MAAKPDLRVFFDDLVRAETRLYNAANDRLRERHGIVTSQYEFLAYVRDHETTRVADISAAFAIGIGATSKGMDRLEKSGWLARRPNPGDRRSSLLVLTAEGLELVNAAEVTFENLLVELLGPEFPADAARFAASLRRRLEDAGLGMPTG